MSGTPVFVITDIGLAVASVATPSGPFIELSTFAVGDAVGYDPSPSDTSLNGVTLYSGAIAGYTFLPDNTINVICKIPADAGPFDFGEVGLYLADGTLFAKAAFDQKQQKFSSLGSALALTYTFNCLLRLQQSVAVFKIVSDTGGGSGSGSTRDEIQTVSKWSDVIPPLLSMDPTVNQLRIVELDNKDQATFLIKSDDVKWTVASTYNLLGEFAVKAAVADKIEIDVSDWPYMDSRSTDYPVEDASMVIETNENIFRSVASISYVGSPVHSVRFTLNPDPLTDIPAVASVFNLFINDLTLVLGYRSVTAVTPPLGDNSNNLATTEYADRAALNAPMKRSDGTQINFIWQDQLSRTRFWGSNDGINMYPVAPANMAVGYAANGGVTSVNGQTGAVNIASGGSIKAYANFTQIGTTAIRNGASHNVSSLTDMGVGHTRINFANALPSSGYAVVVGFGTIQFPFGWYTQYASEYVRTTTYMEGRSVGGGATLGDIADVNVAIIQ